MKLNAVPLLLAFALSAPAHASKLASSLNNTQQNCGVRRNTPDMEALVARNVGAVELWRKAASNQNWTQRPELPKVAFVFLLEEGWPMEGVWADWLAGQDKNKYKVVIHSKAGSWRPKHDILSGSEMHYAIPNGRCNLVNALLGATEEAIKGGSVVQVVTMCARTAPIKPFEQVYNELTNDPKTRMCIDGDWKNRGMPFSYTWTRRDAELFSQNSKTLHAMFVNVPRCDIEDFFVVPAKLANRPYESSCVTWSGWNPIKGFSISTNGKHYAAFLKDPLNKMAPVTDMGCSHPLDLQELSEKSIKSLLDDPAFLFARKLSGDNMKINSNINHHVTLQTYLKLRISTPAQ